MRGGPAFGPSDRAGPATASGPDRRSACTGNRSRRCRLTSRTPAEGQDDALPSVETTMRFLALCEQYGSNEAAVAAVEQGRRAGVPGLPDRVDWTAWNAAEMRAAVDYLQAADAATDSGASVR